MLNVLFMGTPDFARKSLEEIYNSGFNIIGIVTNPDKPKGRGMKMIASPVKEFGLEKGIPVYQPLRIKRNESFIEEIKSLKPDVICVVAYGKILPKEILDIPKLGCINVHGSLLPKYRGAAPIQWAIINGEKQTGITTMYMDTGMDTGDMILKEVVDIGEDETTGELWEKLSKVGGKLLVNTLKLIENENAPREKQGDDFTFAPMLDKEMALINWNKKSAQEIKNLVRGLNPIIGAYTYINDKKIKLWKVDIISIDDFLEKNIVSKNELENRIPGSIIFASDKKGLFIKAKDAVIEAIEIQVEGSKKMNSKDFLRGHSI